MTSETPSVVKQQEFVTKDLGLVSMSVAVKEATSLINEKVSFKIKFTCKKDDWVHTFEHTCSDAEFMTDQNGVKWKRIE